MIVVSDTSPLNYLVLLSVDHVLPVLFGQVLAPTIVLSELQHANAPLQVQAWAKNPPSWLEIREAIDKTIIGRLGPGESAAIALAQECNADALLIDERDGTAVARSFGLEPIGTLAILALAAEKDLLSLPVAFAELRRTTFRIPVHVLDELLRVDQSRRSSKQQDQDEPA